MVQRQCLLVPLEQAVEKVDEGLLGECVLERREAGLLRVQRDDGRVPKAADADAALELGLGARRGPDEALGSKGVFRILLRIDRDMDDVLSL